MTNLEIKQQLCKQIINLEKTLTELQILFEKLPDIPIFWKSDGFKSYYRIADETGDWLPSKFTDMESAYKAFQAYAKSLGPIIGEDL